MRSGSSAHDDHDWPPSARHPYAAEATSGQARYGTHGPQPRSGPPDDAAGGWREVPFGPEISWPSGFRPLDTQAREILEAGYRAAPSYQQPALHDHGYGDPGYLDPAYDGPRTPYSGPGPADRGGAAGAGYQGVPGYQLPEPPGYAGPAHQRGFAERPAADQDIYPVTGAQEALQDTGPQPWPTGSAPAGYPDRWYGSPRLDDRALGGTAPDGPGDRRLAGLRYDELRYDEPGYDERRYQEPSPGPAYDEPRYQEPSPGSAYDEPRYQEPSPGRAYDEPLDDESWYQELRRSTPAYPQRGELQPGGPQPGGSRPGASPEDQGPWRGAGSPAAARSWAAAGPATGGPWRGAVPEASAARRHAVSPAEAFGGAGYLGAPTAQTDVLAPPPGGRADARPQGGALLAAPGTAEFAAAGTAEFAAAPGGGRSAVRPGYGLDGPEITLSWPARPQADDLDAFDEFWREDGGYSALLADEAGRDDGRRTGRRKATAGRRRGRSNDRRLWLALGGVVVVTAAAIAGIIKFEFPSHSGPAHTMITPAAIGSYVRTVDLEHQTHLAQLRAEVIKMSSGQASHVVSAVYEAGNSAAGGNAQIIMFIGGHLANAAPAASIASFTQKFPGAVVVSAGPLGGDAACVEQGVGTSSTASMCAWFDNDSFGEVVSPTMNAAALASSMRTFRRSVELVDKR
jgi:hypothetical protein